MTQMTARYPGTCAATGKRFPAGALIDYDRRTKTAKLVGDQAEATWPEEGRYISDVFRIGGKEFYRNKRGTCEDAPACGCCTI